ncbi:MAG: hypothetical protein LBU90_00940 [Bacteroidales bacterium]|jgi:hypothetical protein|nr:hypothetical protein [Bacteroidales bacterium]
MKTKFTLKNFSMSLVVGFIIALIVGNLVTHNNFDLAIVSFIISTILCIIVEKKIIEYVRKLNNGEIIVVSIVVGTIFALIIGNIFATESYYAGDKQYYREYRGVTVVQQFNHLAGFCGFIISGGIAYLLLKQQQRKGQREQNENVISENKISNTLK